jgi:hypothetical protein
MFDTPQDAAIKRWLLIFSVPVNAMFCIWYAMDAVGEWQAGSVWVAVFHTFGSLLLGCASAFIAWRLWITRRSSLTHQE